MEMRNSFKIVNQGEDNAQLSIYGIIGDYWDELDAKDVVTAIEAISKPNITVRIHSDGGSVFAGLAIYNALVRHPANIIVEIDALAASTASIIAMSGTVRMPENAFMMIHNPLVGVRGEAKELLAKAALLVKIKDSLVKVYTDKTGQTTEKVSEMMDDETWLTAREAKDLGFADEVIGAVSDPENRMSAFLNQYVNINGTEARITQMKEIGMEITLEMIKKEHPEIANALIEEGKKLELSRIKDVKSATRLPGHEELANTLMFDGVTTGGEAAMAVIRAEEVILNKAASAADTEAPAPAPAAVQGDPIAETVMDSVEPTDEVSAKAKFDKDAKIRAEFGDFDVYLAYIKSTTAGLVKERKGGK